VTAFLWLKVYYGTFIGQCETVMLCITSEMVYYYNYIMMSVTSVIL